MEARDQGTGGSSHEDVPGEVEQRAQLIGAGVAEPLRAHNILGEMVQ